MSFWLFWYKNRWPWFTWWFNHLPRPSISPKRTPMVEREITRKAISRSLSQRRFYAFAGLGPFYFHPTKLCAILLGCLRRCQAQIRWLKRHLQDIFECYATPLGVPLFVVPFFWKRFTLQKSAVNNTSACAMGWRSRFGSVYIP